MESIRVIVNNSKYREDNSPSDFVVQLDPPFELTGKWSCHLASIHFAWVYPDGTSGNKIDSPIFMTADFIDNTRINRTNASILGLFSLECESPKGRVYKKAQVTFVRDRFIPVTKQYILTARFRLVNKDLKSPTLSIFRGNTTLELIFRKDE